MERECAEARVRAVKCGRESERAIAKGRKSGGERERWRERARAAERAG